MTIHFYIKRPTNKNPDLKVSGNKGQRRTFSLYQQTILEDGSTKNITLSSPAIDSVNEQYLAGLITFKTAYQNFENLRKTEYKKIGINIEPHVFNNQNQRILDEYWEREYSDRDLIDTNAAKNKLQRAILALGNVSLLTATKKEIQDQISSHNFSNNKQREVVGKLNNILKFIKRSDVRLAKKKKVRVVPKYLNETEMESVALQMGDETLYHLIRVLFYSGLRIGEAFAVTDSSIRGKYLNVISQIDKDDIERAPKWGSVRKAYFFSQGQKSLSYWIANKDKVTLSREAISKRFKAICKRTFNSSSKICKLHDLRHSYAINLLTFGVNLTLVAQSLGNSVVVAEEYYSGFTLTDETIDTIDRYIRNSN